MLLPALGPHGTHLVTRVHLASTANQRTFVENLLPKLTHDAAIRLAILYIQVPEPNELKPTYRVYRVQVRLRTLYGKVFC